MYSRRSERMKRSTSAITQMQTAIIIVILIVVVAGGAWAYYYLYQPPEEAALTVATMSVTLAMPWLSTSDIPGYGAQYWAEEEGVEVTCVEIPIGQLYDKIMTELRAGTGAFDIIAYPSYWAGDIMGGDYVLDLDDYLTQYADDVELAYDDFKEVYRERLNMWGGDTYGIQIDGDVWCLFYREDIMENATNQANFEAQYGYPLRSPRTWDEYLDVAAFFTGWDWDNDGEIEYGATEITNRAGAYMIWNYWSRYAPAIEFPDGKPGAIYFDPDNMDPLINSPPGEKALQNWIDTLQYCPPGAEDATYEATWDHFLGGRAFMTHQWPDLGPLGNDPDYSGIVGKSGYGMIPGWEEAWDFETDQWVTNGTGLYWEDGIHYGSPLAWGWTASIAKNTKYPDLAFELIKYVVSPEQAALQAAEAYDGLDPYRQQIFDQGKAKTGKIAEVFADVLPGWENYDEFFEALDENIEVGVPDLRVPSAFRFYETLSVQISNVFAGLTTKDTALAIAESEWTFVVESLGTEYLLGLYQESLG